MKPIIKKNSIDKSDEIRIYLKENTTRENEINSKKSPENKRKNNINVINDEFQNASKDEIFGSLDKNRKEEKKEGTKNNNYVENNISVKNIVDDALFTQLSKINVKLLEFNDNSKNSLPKIDFVEIKLLNQNTSISEFKDYGFGLYVFFLYLKSLLVTFLILSVYAFHYIYRIFYDYYRDYEDEFSFYSDYNLLTLISGSQILRFRKFIIETYGKETFLEKYKDFDVFYKEYMITGTAIFIIAFIVNFIFLLYILREYKEYRLENPEIKNYSLILSGKDVPYQEDINNNSQNLKSKIFEELNLDEDKAEINFTLKLSDYYKKMEKHIKLTTKQNKIENTIKIKRCCCYCCCCLCSCCFCCCKKKYDGKVQAIKDKISDLEKGMNEIKEANIHNPLYIITFKNKEDYNRVYSNYPHSYLTNLCGKKKIYINKAPSPEDVAWENLEFDNEHKYFKHKLINVGIFLGCLLISFASQIIGELIDHYLNYEYIFFINIILSYGLGKLEDCFNEKISNQLTKKSNSWSYSDTKFYSIIFQCLFKFISKGIFPFLTSFIIQIYFNEEDNNYSDLASKMFVLIEMDGFGYPMIDWFYGVYKKGKEMQETTEKILKTDNVEKEITDQVTNPDKLSKLELKDSFEKNEMELEDLFSDSVAIYWITMLYLSIYPVGLIQSFFNLLFKFIIEKNFLLNAYKRPEYTNPQFGFLCFNFFNIGFFLFLCGNFIIFRNEENKQSFGIVYIIIMILILVIPFYYLGKFIMFITNYCCLNQKEENRLNNINRKRKSDYRLFNPFSQKEKVKEIFEEFKSKKNDNLLNENQYNKIIEKLEEINYKGWYNLGKKMRTHKIMTFEVKKMNSGELFSDDGFNTVIDDEKHKLYYLLMQLGLITYLEENNALKPQKKPIKFDDIKSIRSITLRNLYMQEFLSNSDAGVFTIYQDKRNKKDFIMAYVYNRNQVKLLDIFSRRILDDVKGLVHTEKIVCLDYFTFGGNRYLVTLGLDNLMIIKNLTENEEPIKKGGIADNYTYSKDNKNYFSLSAVEHDNGVWILTSYFSNNNFKIYKYLGKSEGIVQTIVPTMEPIISLEGLYFTPQNTYICIRTPRTVDLYMNQHFLKRIKVVDYDSYINFKVVELFDLIIDNKIIIITTIKNDLTSYNVEIMSLFPIFPLFTPAFEYWEQRMTRISFAQSINSRAYVEIDANYAQQLSEDTNNNPIITHTITIPLEVDNNQRNNF